MDHISSLETFLVFGIGALVIPCVILLGWFKVNATRRAAQVPGDAVPVAEVTRQ